MQDLRSHSIMRPSSPGADAADAFRPIQRGVFAQGSGSLAANVPGQTASSRATPGQAGQPVSPGATGPYQPPRDDQGPVPTTPWETPRDDQAAPPTAPWEVPRDDQSDPTATFPVGGPTQATPAPWHIDNGRGYPGPATGPTQGRVRPGTSTRGAGTSGVPGTPRGPQPSLNPQLFPDGNAGPLAPPVAGPGPQAPFTDRGATFRSPDNNYRPQSVYHPSAGGSR